MVTHYPIYLELNSATPCSSIIDAHCGDEHSRYIDVNLTSNGLAVPLTTSMSATYDATINNVIVASDLNAFTDTDKNIFVIPITKDMLIYYGTLNIDLKISEFETLITAQTIKVKVAKAVINNESIIIPENVSIRDAIKGKLDKSVFDEEIVKRVDFQTFNTELSKKLDASIFNDELEKKVDKTTYEMQMADKVDNLTLLSNYSTTSSCNEKYELVRDMSLMYIGIDDFITSGKYYTYSYKVTGLPTDITNGIVFIDIVRYGGYVHQSVFHMYSNYESMHYTRFGVVDSEQDTLWYDWHKTNVDNTFNPTSSNAPSCISVYSELIKKADIETGYISKDNIAWYSSDSSKKITGSYQLCGDYCTISATASLISGWKDVYYSLPVPATAKFSIVVHRGDDNYYISATELSNISVLKIASIYGNAQPNGTIDFVLNYKYK